MGVDPPLTGVDPETGVAAEEEVFLAALSASRFCFDADGAIFACEGLLGDE